MHYLQALEIIKNHTGITDLKQEVHYDYNNNDIGLLLFLNPDSYAIEEENIVGLNLSNRGLRNIDFIQNFISLKELHFSGNQISDLSPLKSLKNLQRLNLSNNQISDLSPLKDLKNLQELVLGGNQVSNLSPLKDLKNLQILYFWENRISDLAPLKNFANLKELNFSYNQVSDLSVLKNLKNLQDLGFSYNQVSDLSPLKDLQNLKKLSFGNNQVSDLSPLKDLQNLQMLDFISNQVSDLSPLKDLQNLKMLHFLGNHVLDISALKDLKNLQDLWFNENINSLTIQNFKSHQQTTIHFGNLTLLCGQNGVGKSSIIQVLLLLRQSEQKNVLSKYLSLHKPLCSLGTAQEVLFAFAENQTIQLDLKTTCRNFNFEFDAKEDFDFLPTIKRTTPFFDENLPLFNKNFQYISAYREAKYDSNDYEVNFNWQISIEEGRTELTAQFLYKYQTEQVLEALLHPSQAENNLLAQTAAWIREIDATVLDIVPKNMFGAYEIYYRLKGLPEKKEFKKQNMAFGVSYVLPIVVAVLSARQDALIIIENPEAHLHPYGKAKLTELLCLAAQAGVQIVIETHSDHIVNGTLVQCKKFETENKGIDKNKVKIWHFDKDEQHISRAIEVEIKEKGRIKNSPKGFFDQIDKDLNILI